MNPVGPPEGSPAVSEERRNRRKTEDQPAGGAPKPGAGSPPAGQVIDRRLGLDRRDIEDAKDEGSSFGSKPTGLERRRGPGRRLSDFTKSAEEGEMTREQFMFLMAIEEFKRANGKTFPSWTDVLEVIRLLGYRKTMATELTLRNAEDWREPPNAPSSVRPPKSASRDREIERELGEDRDAA